MEFNNILKAINESDLTDEQRLKLLEAVETDSNTFNEHKVKEQEQKAKGLPSIEEIAEESRIIK